MAEPFLGEIRMFSFAFAPKGWAQCNGQLLPLQQNQALYALLQTKYGGNGTTNFGLPDLRGKVPISFGAGIPLGQSAGSNSVAITFASMPGHVHSLSAANVTPTDQMPSSNLAPAAAAIWADPNSNPQVTMHPSALSNTGGSQAHENRQPFLTIDCCIALQGIFPSP